MTQHIRSLVTFAAVAGIVFVGCVKDRKGDATTQPLSMKPHAVMQPSIGEQKRFGDEIVVAGHLYRIGTPVVTWMDPGGYDAYSTARHFVPYDRADFESTMREYDAKYVGDEREKHVHSPNRFNVRYADVTTRATTRASTQPDATTQAFFERVYPDATTRPFTPEQFKWARNDSWSLQDLQAKVDQFVLHYDVAGISSECFKTLQDDRGLSVQFMLDIDGTLYQTLDLKERAWQATKANDRSIGIEIANIGSYSAAETTAPLQQWYKKDAGGKTYIAVPERLGGVNATRIPGIYRPMRNDVVVGQIRGVTQRMYDLTPQQYDTLIKLTAALGDIFPQIKLVAPRDADGNVIMRTLTDAEYDGYKGVMGHYHVQGNKSDPGVALQWDYLLGNARRLLAERRPMVATK